MNDEILQCLWTNALTCLDISDKGSKWENDFNQIGDITHNFKSVQPKIILTPLVMVSSFWEEEFIVIFSFIKISLSLHISIWIKQLKFGQNNLENTGVCWSYNCFLENNFDKSVIYGTTKILKNQFKGKHSKTKGCTKTNTSMIRPQHVDKRKLNKCIPVY
jgi:hypothetical protein